MVPATNYGTKLSSHTLAATTTRTITWLSLRSDNDQYAVAGDSGGCISLYRMDRPVAHNNNKNNTNNATNRCERPIQVLTHTSAAMRERQRLCNLYTVSSSKKGYGTNAIVQCSWCRALVALLTSTELEIVQIMTSTTNNGRRRRGDSGAMEIYEEEDNTDNKNYDAVDNRKQSKRKKTTTAASWGGRDKMIILASFPLKTAGPDSSQTAKKISAQQSPCLQIQSSSNMFPCRINGAKTDSKPTRQYQIMWTSWHRELLKGSTDTAVADGSTANGLLLLEAKIDETNGWFLDDNYKEDNDVVMTEQESSPLGRTTSDGAFWQLNQISKLAPKLTSSVPTVFRCWASIWEKVGSFDTQGNFLMIAQTGYNSVELLRARLMRGSIVTVGEDVDAKLDVPFCLEHEDFEIVTRQSMPYTVTNTRTTNTNTATDDALFSIPDCCLQQFGDYLFVTGAVAKGIRMFRTETLEAVACFGETVQLHGKLVQWNRCAWVKAERVHPSDIRMDTNNININTMSTTSNTNAGAFTNAANTTSNCNFNNGSSGGGNIVVGTSAVGGKKKLSWWLEHKDELAAREYNIQMLGGNRRINNFTTNDTEYWLIGFPHPFKGATELKTTLYFWKLSTANEVLQNTATVTLHGPVGGCTSDIYVAPGCARMMCLGGETGRLYEWGPTVRTDFAGVMYPVGYKVVADNLEYIEDEDELDQPFSLFGSNGERLGINVGTSVHDSSIVDPDLAEALRLSLLDHSRQQTNLTSKGVEAISVLLDCDDDIDDEFLLPCWPDIEESDSDESSVVGSPQRSRSFSNAGVVEESEDNAFELVFLVALPHIAAIRKEVKYVAQKRAQKQETADQSGCVDKPKVKGKRTRTANVEVLLNSSIDLDLRLCVGKQRSEWGQGQGSTHEMNFEQNNDQSYESRGETRPVNIMQSASPEEKALAMELLLLSPSHNGLGHPVTLPVNEFRHSGVSPTDAVVKNWLEISEPTLSSSAPLSEELPDSTVTPSEHSPPDAKLSFSSILFNDGSCRRAESRMDPACCFACMGRMVLHSCGMREKPIDYDAIAREDEERKEIEEAEKVRLRTEKRRLAEAKRRETRRQKKIDDVQKHIEVAEKMSLTEVSQVGQNKHTHAGYEEHSEWTNQDMESAFVHSQVKSIGKISSYSKNSQDHVCSDENNALESSAGLDGCNGNGTTVTDFKTQSYQSRVLWTGASQDGKPFHHETIQINGNNVNPSTCLNEMDALAALAGLADSIVQPVPDTETSRFRPNKSENCVHFGMWQGNGIELGDTRSHQQTYTYHGSDERRATIAHGFQSSMQHEPSVVGYGGREKSSESLQSEEIPFSLPSGRFSEENDPYSRDLTVAPRTTITHFDYRDSPLGQMDVRNQTPSSPVSLDGDTVAHLNSAMSHDEISKSYLTLPVVKAQHATSNQISTHDANDRNAEWSHLEDVRSELGVISSQQTEKSEVKFFNRPHALQDEFQEESQAHALLALAYSASPKQNETCVVSSEGGFLQALPHAQGSDLSAAHAMMVAGFLQQSTSAFLQPDVSETYMLDDTVPLKTPTEQLDT